MTKEDVPPPPCEEYVFAFGNVIEISGRVIMPAALRPSFVAILLAVTPLCVIGCAFPFTRGGDAQLDQVMQGESDNGARNLSKPAPKPSGSKPLPPFARFLGGLFRDDAGPEAQVAANKGITANESAGPAQDVPGAPTAEVPTQKAAPVVAADVLLAQGTPTAPKAYAPDDKAAQDPQMPVIIAPVDVTQATVPPQRVADPAVPPVQLDQYTQTPWDTSQSLLRQATQNRSDQSTTLSHSLDLALEHYRQESTGQSAPVEAVAITVDSSQDSSEPVSRTEVTTNPERPLGDEESSDLAENPLRRPRGKTDWSGRSTQAGAEPQTIINSMASNYPKADSQPQKVTNDTVMANQPIAESKPAPTATPRITHNPFAEQAAKPAAAQPTAPQIVTNPMVVPTADLEPKSISTDAIHFQSSLLEKLQAANQQAVWKFEQEMKEPAGEIAPTVVAEPASDLPQIVSSKEVTPQPEKPSADAESGMIMNPLVSPSPSAEPEMEVASTPPSEPVPSDEPTEPATPPVGPEPATRPHPSRGAIIRAAQPSPLIINNNEAQPKLPPVVRASEHEAPGSTGAHRGTKIYVIEGKSP